MTPEESRWSAIAAVATAAETTAEKLRAVGDIRDATVWELFAEALRKAETTEKK